MGKVIMVASGKGGTGKTTVTANLGAELSARGKLTVLVDTDMGLRNLDIALGLESSVVYDFSDWFEGRCEIDDILIKADGHENLYFIAAPQSKPTETEKSEEFWELLKNRFEFCIADAPAGMGEGFGFALSEADMAVIVTLPEAPALRDADRTISVLEEAGVKDIRLLINKVHPDMIDEKIMPNMDECMDMLGVPIIGIAPYDEEVLKSALKSKTAVNNPASCAGTAFRNTAARLCGEAVPIMEFKKQGFWGKLKELFRK